MSPPRFNIANVTFDAVNGVWTVIVTDNELRVVMYDETFFIKPSVEMIHKEIQRYKHGELTTFVVANRVANPALYDKYFPK